VKLLLSGELVEYGLHTFRACGRSLGRMKPVVNGIEVGALESLEILLPCCFPPGRAAHTILGYSHVGRSRIGSVPPLVLLGGMDCGETWRHHLIFLYESVHVALICLGPLRIGSSRGNPLGGYHYKPEVPNSSKAG
jgi:hypothetical protein